MLGFICSESQGTELLSRIIEAYLLQYREMATPFVTPADGYLGGTCFVYLYLDFLEVTKRVIGQRCLHIRSKVITTTTGQHSEHYWCIVGSSSASCADQYSSAH